jgi:hypothetical protein
LAGIIKIDPTAAPPGYTVNISLIGWNSSETVSIDVVGKGLLSPVITDGTGNADVNFQIPTTWVNGTYAFKATGSSSSGAAQWNITVTAGLIPSLASLRITSYHVPKYALATSNLANSYVIEVTNFGAQNASGQVNIDMKHSGIINFSLHLQNFVLAPQATYRYTDTTIWNEDEINTINVLQFLSSGTVICDNIIFHVLPGINGAEYFNMGAVVGTVVLGGTVPVDPTAGTLPPTETPPGSTGTTDTRQWWEKTLLEVIDPVTGQKVRVDQNFLGFFSSALTPLTNVVWDGLDNLLSSAGPVNIDEIVGTAMSMASGAMIADFGIYAAATMTDLLHPLKGTGIVPAAIDIVNTLGTKLVTHGIIGAYTDTTLNGPLKKHFAKIARPSRPDRAMADQMYFEKNITLEQWLDYYQYLGFPDDVIEAWNKTMFSEPSDRLLISMFEDPGLSKDWIIKKLEERGYNGADIDVITQYAIEKAKEKTRSTSSSISFTRLKKGYTELGTFQAELAGLGYRADQIQKMSLQAVFTRDTDYRDEMLKVYTDSFRKDVISLDAFRSSVYDIMDDRQQADRLILLEELRKTPKSTAEISLAQSQESPRLANLELQSLRLDYQKGIISDADLAAGLAQIISDPRERAEILKIEQTKRLPNLKKGTILTAFAERQEVEKMTADTLVLQFKKGSLTEQALTEQLTTIIDNPDIVRNIVTQARLQKAASP